MRLLAGILMNAGLYLLLLSPSITSYAAERAQITKDIPIVVIDPGHGGTNNGSMEGQMLEKDMNLITSVAMWEALNEYEDISVFLTRDGDIDLSLEERALIAKRENADMLICMHYNGSESHSFYGAEAWVCGFAPYNTYGYQLADIMLNELNEEFGIFNRGIKTKFLENGSDYYGIIREAKKQGIPTVLFEHAHVDNDIDKPYISDEEKLKAIGRADAIAVAKYFGLKKKDGSEDYSDYSYSNVKENEVSLFTYRDTTEPDEVTIKLKSINEEMGKVSIRVNGYDKETCLNYYAVSLDGGETYSELYTWPGAYASLLAYKKNFITDLDVSGINHPQIVIKAYNAYDQCTESNILDIDYDFSSNNDRQVYIFDPKSFVAQYDLPKPAEGEIVQIPPTKFFVLFVGSFTVLMIGIMVLIHDKRK